jgi:hypothetical protein
MGSVPQFGSVGDETSVGAVVGTAVGTAVGATVAGAGVGVPARQALATIDTTTSSATAIPKVFLLFIFPPCVVRVDILVMVCVYRTISNSLRYLC